MNQPTLDEFLAANPKWLEGQETIRKAHKALKDFNAANPDIHKLPANHPLKEQWWELQTAYERALFTDYQT